MTIYIVRAKPKKNLIKDLHKQLESGQISQLKPFGKALIKSNVIDVIENKVMAFIEKNNKNFV
jgi:hypothetical protein